MTTATFGYAPRAYSPVVQLRPSQLRPAQVRPDRARTHLRLTKRGRTVFTTLAAIPLVIAALFFAINGGGAGATVDNAPAGSYDYVTVQAGESLWAMAVDIAPTADPRDVVSDILAFNGMSSSQIMPGQRLAIPTQYS